MHKRAWLWVGGIALVTGGLMATRDMGAEPSPVGCGGPCPVETTTTSSQPPVPTQHSYPVESTTTSTSTIPRSQFSVPVESSTTSSSTSSSVADSSTSSSSSTTSPAASSSSLPTITGPAVVSPTPVVRVITSISMPTVGLPITE